MYKADSSRFLGPPSSGTLCNRCRKTSKPKEPQKTLQELLSIYTYIHIYIYPYIYISIYPIHIHKYNI